MTQDPSRPPKYAWFYVVRCSDAVRLWIIPTDIIVTIPMTRFRFDTARTCEYPSCSNSCISGSPFCWVRHMCSIHASRPVVSVNRCDLCTCPKYVRETGRPCLLACNTETGQEDCGRHCRVVIGVVQCNLIKTLAQVDCQRHGSVRGRCL